MTHATSHADRLTDAELTRLAAALSPARAGVARDGGWFAAHPGRRVRVRWALPGEGEAYGVLVPANAHWRLAILVGFAGGQKGTLVSQPCPLHPGADLNNQDTDESALALIGALAGEDMLELFVGQCAGVGVHLQTPIAA